MADRSRNGQDKRLFIGVDVGSTTVKCAVLDGRSGDILWSRYERHETRQAEKTAEMLSAIEADFAHVPRESMRVFITGSGAGPIAEPPAKI